MIAADYLFGFQYKDIEMARKLVEQALGIHMVSRESLFYGGDYYKYVGEKGETLILQENIDLIDNTFAEPDFPNVGILFYVYFPMRSNVFEQTMAKQVPDAHLLRKEYGDGT